MKKNSLLLNHGYEVVETQDGSLSLKSLQSLNQEIMHHSGGAWAETKYIYGRPLQKALEGHFVNSIASVGLGLGYNELLSAKSSIVTNCKFQLYSFEKDLFLAESFRKFILNESLDSELREIYDSVLKFVTEDIDTGLIKEKLKSMYHNSSWQIFGPLESSDLNSDQNFKKFNVVLYDAFSSKTSPELWSEEFLSAFLKDFTADDCILSTYACKGSLKKALKQNEFQFLERPGFMGKRNSTLGVRGLKYSLPEWRETF